MLTQSNYDIKLETENTHIIILFQIHTTLLKYIYLFSFVLFRCSFCSHGYMYVCMYQELLKNLNKFLGK